MNDVEQAKQIARASGRTHGLILADEVDRLEAELKSLRGDPDEPHLIEFRDDGWTIQHTLHERQTGSLFDCPRSHWNGGDPGVRGRFVLVDDLTYGDAA